MKLETQARVLAIVDGARSLGQRKLANGTELIGHIPHLAPEAYLHVIFPPLNTERIAELAGNPNNVELVTRAENLTRHGGNWRNATVGPLLDRGAP